MTDFAGPIVGVPSKAFRPAIVLDDECMECKRPLGDRWHVNEQKVLCDRCFAGKVAERNAIDTDTYRELPE